jgi:type IV pilus assembly protein PilX
MKHDAHTPTSHRVQRGMSLIFALLSLVALSLGAVALIRSVDTGTLVLGNLGFKQDATATADKATESAIGFLSSCTNLNADTNSTTAGCLRNGYYASSHDGVDVTGQQSGSTRELVDWEGDDKCSFALNAGKCTLDPYTVATDTNGVKTQYVIFRLCNAVGAITTDSACVKPPSTAGTSTKRGKLDYSDYARFTTDAGPFYRIVVRSVSGRNTASFTETIVHF